MMPVVALLLVAQAASEMGSVSGVVREAGTGKPIARLAVWAGSQKAETDEAGRYSVRLSPGSHRVTAGMRIMRSSPGFASRSVTLAPGEKIDSFDFSVRLNGSISGRILDASKEPLPGMEVALLAREYRAGSLHRYRRNATISNDQGEYRLEGVAPGEAYLVLAMDMRRGMKPVSEVPDNPKNRKPAAVPTYYPNSPLAAGSELITLRPGEQREGVDIQVARSASFCVEGKLLLGGRPAEMQFFIHDEEISFSMGQEGGVTGIPPWSKSGPDGAFRVCGLARGVYKLTALSGDINEPSEYGSTLVTITDRDVGNVTVTAPPSIPIAGRVVLEGPPPEKAVAGDLRIILSSMNRSMGGTMYSASMAVPGEFAIKGGRAQTLDPLLDDYIVRFFRVPAELYLKDALYGNSSVRSAPLRPGAAMTGSELRVVLGTDGGTVQIRVETRDGKPAPDASVVLIPQETRSQEELVALSVAGWTDQRGEFRSPTIAPGKYFVLAAEEGDTGTGTAPEVAAKLWAARMKAKVVELPPKGSVRLTIEPMRLE
jgi:hypothetical protein